MKVLIVNSTDIQGGAARAAYRLHQSLLSQNIDSQMLVQIKSSDDFTVLGPVSRMEKGINMLRPILNGIPISYSTNRKNPPFSYSWIGFSSIADRINKINPDIAHLHWINGGMMRIEDIAKINAPIVWSLHDMWAFTGGCNYDEGCGAYKVNCGSCKVLWSRKKNDLSRKVILKKQKVFSNISNMTLVCVSRWLEQCTKESALFKDKQVINLPNPINTEIFKPFDRQKAKELWGLPLDKKLVLFGAPSAASNPRKGFKELSESLYILKATNVEFVVFGCSEPQDAQNFGFKTHYLGKLHDDVSLVTLYSSADVMLVPSLQEAFGQTVSESMACGTPVVAFAHTGLLDIIDHKSSGYLAKPFETADLAKGIEWVLNIDNYKEISQAARKKVLRDFDSKVVAKKYIELYKDVLDCVTQK